MNDLFGDAPVRALSWKQPFLELMSHDKIETRTWPTKYRGIVVMCASKTSYKTWQLIGICGHHQLNRITALISHKEAEMYANRGKALKVGMLVGCRPMNKEDEDKCFVEYHSTLWCHIYTNVRNIEPFPWKGSQGWRTVEPAIADKIKYI